MAKNLLDMLLDEILRKEKPPPPQKHRFKKKEEEPAEISAPDPEADELAAQAAKETEARARKKVAEAMKKAETAKAEAISKVKRLMRNEDAAIKKENERKEMMSLLEADTKRMKWKLGGGASVMGFLDGKPAFEIKRGVVTYGLRVLPVLRERATKAGVGNLFSSVGVQQLKEKAEKILKTVEAHERKKA